MRRLTKTLLLLSCLCSLAALAPPVWANDLEDALRNGHAAGNLPGLHSVYVSRDGTTLAETYFEGPDQVWGADIGNRQHGPQTLHDLRGMTASIVGLLYGIALADGLVPAPNAPLLAQFPEHSDLSTPQRDAITIGDVLTMRMGTVSNEPQASEAAGDPVRDILSQMVADPAPKTFHYTDGATTLLAELITRGSGEPIDVFARERLFAPLGITRSEWLRGADGRPSAATGLRLSARGLAQIGMLVLKDGSQDGVQIIPADWLKASLTPHAQTDQLRFGYHWWLSPKDAPDWAAAHGNGGQRLSVVPSLGLVVVVQAGNYDQDDAWQVPVSVLTQYILPALEVGQ